MPPRVEEVFTPSSPATYTFVERDAETSRRIDRALRTPGMQLVVYGQTGTGKTTLVRNRLAELGPEIVVTSRCASSTTFSDLVCSALSQLGAKYTFESTEGGSAKGFQVGGSVFGTGGEVAYQGKATPSATHRQVAPPPATAEQLGIALGTANAVWVIEDLHKIVQDESRHLAETMKLFMDLASDYPDLRIIVLGARDTASEILQLDSEMSNRVAEIGITAMSMAELKGILELGGACLNVEFPLHIRERIAGLACGMPAVAHQLALNMCHDEGLLTPVADEDAEPKLNAATLHKALRVYVTDQAAEFRAAFGMATHVARKSKYDNYNTLLRILSSAPSGLTRQQLLKRIRRRYSQYPASNLDGCMGRLLNDPDRGNLLEFDPLTSFYRYRDPRACAYAAMRFANQRWADYCIVEVGYVDRKVSRVIVRRDEGKELVDPQEWNRAEVIDALLKGTAFVTSAFKHRGWARMGEVRIVIVAGERFLRVDGLQVAKDHLGELRELKEK